MPRRDLDQHFEEERPEWTKRKHAILGRYVVAGAITVEEVMRFGGYAALTVCKGVVRDGILWQETFNGRG